MLLESCSRHYLLLMLSVVVLAVRMKVLSLLYAASNWPVAMAKLLESKSLQSLLRILK